MKIADRVYRIDGARIANAYLVDSVDGLILIDTGMPGSTKRILNYVRQIGHKPADIKYIFLTHADIDHIGSAADLKEATGARLIIHSADAPILSGKAMRRTIKGPMKLIFPLFARLLHCHPVEPDIIVNDNFSLAGLQVIHTPGHSAGSICLYSRGKFIFVGDALRADSVGNPIPPSGSLSDDIIQAKATLKTISQMEYDLLCPGHGSPVRGNAAQKVKDLVARSG
jgi:hydroxyacylglutathione hydrolase